MNPARNPVGAASPADANQLGACIRSTCLLLAQDAHDAARDVADAFSEATGGGALAGDALCALVGESEVTHHAAGTALVVEGARDDTLYVMLSGHATVRRFGAGEIGRLGPGEFFGEIAGTVGTARTASVYATVDCEVLCLSRRALGDLRRFLPAIDAILAAACRDRLLPTMMPPGSGFDLLTEAQRARLFEYFIPVTAAEGTRVLREAQPGAGLCVIVSGQAEVWRAGINGERRVVATLGPGACFGEISLLFDLQVTANVEAATPVTLFVLKPVDFKRFVQMFPEIGAHFVRLAEDRMGRPQVNRVHISAEHHIVRAGTQMNDTERASFTTTAGYAVGVCHACGYADADVVCVSCGTVQ